MIASSALWFSHSPKNCVLMLTMRGKQWGRRRGGVDSPNSPEACRGSHTAQTSFTLQLWNSSCFKVVLRRDWQQLQTSLSFALWVRWEPLNGKPPEREHAPSANRRHLLHHAFWEWDTSTSSLWRACLLWVMCHYDSSTNQFYTGLWQMVEF